MAAMIRKQVYIEAHQDRLLKERASQYRVTEAELIRQAIDRSTQATTQPVDPTAWEEIERYIARRKGRTKAKRTRRWSRESLYDR